MNTKFKSPPASIESSCSLLINAILIILTLPVVYFFYWFLSKSLVNTMTGVVLVCVFMMAPNHVYMLKGIFDDIPWDYEWVAIVDGCSCFQSFRQVIVPSATNGIGVIRIFEFLKGYSEWFFV